MIYFQTCTQIFGVHKALIHVKRKNCVRQLYSQQVYEYVIETETPLSELKTSARLASDQIISKPRSYSGVGEKVNPFSGTDLWSLLIVILDRLITIWLMWLSQFCPGLNIPDWKLNVSCFTDRSREVMSMLKHKNKISLLNKIDHKGCYNRKLFKFTQFSSEHFDKIVFFLLSYFSYFFWLDKHLFMWKKYVFSCEGVII